MTGKPEAMERALVIKSAMLRHGVPQVSIELQAGRPATGDDWNALLPVGVLSHHTASHPTPNKPTPCLWLIKNGRNDLPGPLANGYAGVDLVYRIITLGLANHPGEGGPLRLEGPLGTYVVPRDTARPYMWGTEYEGGYDNQTWDMKYTHRPSGKVMTFREFMGRANAALVEAIWKINHKGKKPTEEMDLSFYHGEHKTWAPARKVDRYEYDTRKGRDEIRKWDRLTVAGFSPNQPDKKSVNLKNVQDAALDKVNKPTASVRRVQRALNEKYDTDIKVDGTWGKKTTKAYKEHQDAVGNSKAYQDGVPGLRDLQALGGSDWNVSTK